GAGQQRSQRKPRTARSTHVCQTIDRDGTHLHSGVLSGLTCPRRLPTPSPKASSMPAHPAALRSSAIPAVAGPTRLRLPDLLQITDQEADDVLSGRYDHLLPAGGIPANDRWFTRLHSDDELDVWLISWVPGETTELHDHGGSLGAMTLLSGALHEFRWAGDELRRRRLTGGDQAAFPLGW